jgi:molybdenum cofactor cytidylyltransferase
MTVDSIKNSACGLILAAGKSSRMGRLKSNLPWRNTTVLGSVIQNLVEGGLTNIYIVISPERKPNKFPIIEGVTLHWVENPRADVDEMLVSIQTGLSALPQSVEYAFICLGDQPTIRPDVVNKLLDQLETHGASLLFPSYRMRRGHPWVVRRDEWPNILTLRKEDTVRTFIQSHAADIHYITFDFDPPEDMDTPEEYQKLFERSGK